MVIVSRSTWGARPAESFTSWDPERLLGVTVHWFGSPNGTSDHGKCDDLLRSVQAGHMAGEFNDIAYNHLVCPHGTVYEGRGFFRQTGANGYGEVNRTYAAVCVMVGKDNPASWFTPAVQRALREILAAWFAKGTGRTVKRHGFWTGSECPGPTIGPWVDSGKWKIEGGVTPVATDQIADWLDEWLYWKFVQGGDPTRRPASAPEVIPDEAWAFAAAMQRVLTHHGASESFLDWADWKLDGSPEGSRPNVPAAVPARWWDVFKRVQKIAVDH